MTQSEQPPADHLTEAATSPDGEAHSAIVAPAALRFERLAVRRMPGIDPPGLAIDQLSSGINVIWGPNASGKTTLARAIEMTIWPRDARRRWAPRHAPWLEATWQLADDAWRVDVEGEGVRYQRAGRDADAPALPAASTRDRYHLCLHDLLQARTAGQGFAEAIVRESAGGYDVPAAAASLGFAASPSQPRGLNQAYRQAIDNYRNARQQQAELIEQERELDDLRRTLAEASAARRRIAIIEHAIECVRHRDAHDEAELARAELPEASGRLTGDEARQLHELREDARRKQAARREAESALATARQQMADTGLGEHGADDALPTQLEKHLAAAERAEQDRDAAAQQRQQAAAERETIAARLGQAVDVERVSQIDREAVEAMAEVFASLERLRAERQSSVTLGEMLSEDAGDDSTARTADGQDGPMASTEALADGARLLQRWLRADAEDQTGQQATDSSQADLTSRVAIAGGGVLVGAGIVGLTLHVASLLATLLGVALLIWAWRRGAGRHRGDGGAVGGGGREVHRREYERLGLTPPPRWEADAVVDHLDHLHRLHATAALGRRREDWQSQTRRRTTQIDQQIEPLQQKRDALLQSHGLAELTDDATAHWVVTHVARLQQADATADAAAAAEGEAQRQADAHLAAISDALPASGATGDSPTRATANDPHPVEQAAPHIAAAADAAGRVRQFNERLRAWTTARLQQEQATQRIAEIDRDLADIATRIERLFATAGLADAAADDAESPDATLDAYCRQRSHYVQLVQQRDVAASQLRSTRAKLDVLVAECEPDTSFDAPETLLACSEAELEQKLREARTEADRWEQLNEQIAAIEQRLAQARQGRDIEDTLAERERTADALRAQREQDERAVVGHLLADYVQQVGRDDQRPAVFHAARRQLSRITRGRYRLELDDAAGGAEAGAGGGAGGGAKEGGFRAIDTTTGRGHGLDELSSGTRVQLLLAVRLAFLETQEQGVRLPLVLDETLANSDETRARAIIDAVTAIADEGRQVFYFTAQDDEVGKWAEALRDRDLPHRFIPLHDAEAEADRLDRVRIELPDRPEPLSIDGHDHASYGRALGVGAIDPRRDVGAVHLWHIVDDLPTLRRLLALGIERWGQLCEMLDHGGGAWLGDAAEADRARATARAIAHICRAWRIGRGRAVDRAALEQSGAVTDRFIDEVDALARELNRDAAALVEALADGQVRGFRRDSRDKLRQHFEAEGYLDPAEPLSPQQLRTRVLAATAEDVQAERLTVEQVERLIAAVG